MMAESDQEGPVSGGGAASGESTQGGTSDQMPEVGGGESVIPIGMPVDPAELERLKRQADKAESDSDDSSDGTDQPNTP